MESELINERLMWIATIDLSFWYDGVRLAFKRDLNSNYLTNDMLSLLYNRAVITCCWSIDVRCVNLYDWSWVEITYFLVWDSALIPHAIWWAIFFLGYIGPFGRPITVAPQALLHALKGGALLHFYFYRPLLSLS